MADPSYTAVWDMIRTAAFLIHQDYLELVANAEKYVDHEDDHKVTTRFLDGPALARSAVALASYRAGRVAGIGAGRSLVDPLLEQMGRVIGATGGPDFILERLDQFMRDAAPDDTVLQRGGTFGAFVAGVGNVGNGPALRVTVDRDGYPLEAARFNDTITVECEQDDGSGALPGQELFRFRGLNPGPDLVEEGGSGYDGILPTDSSDTSRPQNSSWGDLDGTIAVPTSIPGWTPVTSIANFELNETTFHRRANLESVARSLRIKATDGLRQKLSVAGIDVTDPDATPWTWGLFYHPNGSVGTLTIRMGAKTESVAVSGATPANFNNLLYMGLSIPHKDLYYQNWKEDDPDITVEWTHTSGAGILVDSGFFGPLQTLGDTVRRTYATIFAGAVNFLRRDKFTLTDTVPAVAVQGILQQLFVRQYGRALPSVAAAPIIVEPT